MKKKILNKKERYLFIIIVVLFLPFVDAAADFAVNSFSCTPSEVSINDVFSCTAQIKNNGDASGSVSTAALYSDANDWLEESYYTQASGSSVDPGQSVEVTFSGLRAVKSGNNGFSKVMLDDVTDTYVADNNLEVNVINVIVTVSNSESSTASGETFEATAEVTAGGGIDVSLSITISSGGCSIGSQTNPKSITGMNDGNKQSRIWTLTQGSGGDCYYTITASATGSGGIASKSDSTSSSVTCSDCVSGGGTASSGGGGGGGGGGAAAKKYTIGELTSAYSVELAEGEKAVFTLSGTEYTFTLDSFTETSATVTLVETLDFNVGEEKELDLDGDSTLDISVKLKSINTETNKTSFILKPVSKEASGEEGRAPITGGVVSEEEGGEEFIKESSKLLWIVIAIFVIIAVISGYLAFFKKRKHFSGRKFR